MIKGHSLRLTVDEKSKKTIGRCSCGGYTTFGPDAKTVRDRWNKKHVNKFDNWK